MSDDERPECDRETEGKKQVPCYGGSTWRERGDRERGGHRERETEREGDTERGGHRERRTESHIIEISRLQNNIGLIQSNRNK